jgi:hypothetical protein
MSSRPYNGGKGRRDDPDAPAPPNRHPTGNGAGDVSTMDNRLETTSDHYKKAFDYVEANKEHNRKIVLNLPLTEDGCIDNLSVITGMDFVANKRDTDLVLNAIPFEDRDVYLESLQSGSHEVEDEFDFEEDILGECKQLTQASEMSQYEIANKALALKKQSQEAYKASEDHVEEVRTNVVAFKEPEGKYYRPNECFTAAQAAVKIFGSSKMKAPLYRASWRKLLGAFQLGNDVRGSKIYYPKEVVNNYVASLKK